MQINPQKFLDTKRVSGLSPHLPMVTCDLLMTWNWREGWLKRYNFSHAYLPVLLETVLLYARWMVFERFYAKVTNLDLLSVVNSDSLIVQTVSVFFTWCCIQHFGWTPEVYMCTFLCSANAIAGDAGFFFKGIIFRMRCSRRAICVCSSAISPL